MKVDSIYAYGTEWTLHWQATLIRGDGKLFFVTLKKIYDPHTSEAVARVRTKDAFTNYVEVFSGEICGSRLARHGCRSCGVNDKQPWKNDAEKDVRELLRRVSSQVPLSERAVDALRAQQHFNFKRGSLVEREV